MGVKQPGNRQPMGVKQPGNRQPMVVKHPGNRRPTRLQQMSLLDGDDTALFAELPRWPSG